MRRRLALLTTLLVLPLWPGSLQAQDVHDLNGAWIVTSWTTAQGELNEDVQRGLFIFAITRDDGGSYSMMFVPGEEPRAEYGDEMDDAEKMSAYDSFVANSGRLNVQGGSLTYEAYLAKDPNYMASWEDNGATADWSVENDVLTLTFTSGFLDGATARFRRPNSG